MSRSLSAPENTSPRVDVGRIDNLKLHSFAQTDSSDTPEGIKKHLAPTGNLYALIDPERTPNIADRLENSGLRYRNIFVGQPAENADVSPLLVELPASHWLTRSLFTQNEPARPKDMWSAAPLLIQVTVDIDTLHAHLRRFIRAESEQDGRLWFFRFWEPRTAPAYFANLSDRPELITR